MRTKSPAASTCSLRVIGCAAEGQLPESASPGGRYDFRTEADVDVGGPFDVSHQALGHLLAQRGAADDDCH
jgi:hypothetical protein